MTDFLFLLPRKGVIILGGEWDKDERHLLWLVVCLLKIAPASLGWQLYACKFTNCCREVTLHDASALSQLLFLDIALVFSWKSVSLKTGAPAAPVLAAVCHRQAAPGDWRGSARLTGTTTGAAERLPTSACWNMRAPGSKTSREKKEVIHSWGLQRTSATTEDDSNALDVQQNQQKCNRPHAISRHVEASLVLYVFYPKQNNLPNFSISFHHVFFHDSQRSCSMADLAGLLLITLDTWLF